VEEPLAVVVDGRTIQITMRTPGHDEELALGFLLSEGLIRHRTDVTTDDEPREKPNRIEISLRPDLRIDFDKLTRHVFGSSSCGLCGKTAIDRVRIPFESIHGGGTVAADTLLQLPTKLRTEQATFTQTGGLHAAAVFTQNGEPVAVREDIGRHNAVDKILGYGFQRDELPFREHILMVSGRTSFEILQKALAGGFSVIAGISAPSSLAVQFAEQSGQTLIGFLRDDRLNVYAGSQRIRFD
jgi:FdhD protein